MKNKKHVFMIWVLIFLLLFQNVALAGQYIKNTAPIANFTIEKSRNVKILVLSDYTATDSANLKNSISSMKSELANDAKINVEYVTPKNITVGSQNGKFKQNTWGMMGYYTYTWTGYETSTSSGTNTSTNKSEGGSFSYSPTVILPEGETPTITYETPTWYSYNTHRSDGMFGGSTDINYTFYNNNGLCDGRMSLWLQYSYSYPTGFASCGDRTINSYPVFTYDNFWSVMSSYDADVTNTVLGWDLSKLNYDAIDGTDTYVIFAMNNESTNYYLPYASSTYRLGQLRSDANLGKYVKDSNARVYSICSENFENVNLSKNAQYPVTLTPVTQNISVKDLINMSYDGRSIGTNNVSGLVKDIKENIKKPTGNIDMVVATDEDAPTTNEFINSIKNDVSDEVDLSTNIVDTSSLETTGAWNKYTVKNNFKNILGLSGKRSDVNILLTSDGDLWGQGSNASAYYYESGGSYNYGLLGLGENTVTSPKFTKIASDVKDAMLIEKYEGSGIYDSLVILKNDGTVWITGYDAYYVSGSFKTIYSTFTKIEGLRNITYFTYSLDGLAVVNGAGEVYICKDGAIKKDNLAPSNVKYIICIGHYYYITSNNSVYRIWDGDNKSATYLFTLNVEIKQISKWTGNVLCVDDNVYHFTEWNSPTIIAHNPTKVIFDTGYMDWFLENNKFCSYYNSTALYGQNVNKILYVSNSSDDIIYKLNTGEFVYHDEIHYRNKFSTDNSQAGQTTWTYEMNNKFIPECGTDAIDYLQIGQHLAYIDRFGEINYISDDINYYSQIRQMKKVNAGRIDSILGVTYEPIKAFSKTKIINTTLRDGSDRYFIYISDNIKQDTYLNTSDDYFLLNNLDSELVNYLKTNNYNIYVVTPEEAKNLKLEYPNVPNNVQQYTLRDLINSSNADAAFFKNKTELKNIISNKYSTFTKQGSTTLTLVANEEGINYSLVYRDFENDPKYSERWQYIHENTYFDNANGIASYSTQWLDTPVTSFSKVGKYTARCQFRDSPKTTDSFDNYRLWSNISAPATIIVHRRPYAVFNTQIASRAGATVNLAYLDQSYDLDHNISRGDKGIVARSWQYKKTTSNTWIDGRPTSLSYNSGIYQIKLSVKDVEGAWSKPYIDNIDTANIPPSIDATPKSYNGFDKVDITITASDHEEDDFSYMRYAVTTSTTVPSSDSSQWIKVANGIKTKDITINTEGTYYLHMEAYDTADQVGKNMTGPYIIQILKINNATLTGSWNHWRTTWTDKSGHYCPYNPLRFLSLEKVHLNVKTTTAPDIIVVDLSPELKAMKFTDIYGNVYYYKDFFGYEVAFPLTINNPGTNYTWNYILPLANSTISWDNVRKNAPYYLTVTAYKGTASDTKTISNIEITGNVKDLTFNEAVRP